MKKNILIVEDEELMLDAMEMALKSHGYAVETAKNGEDALLKIGEAYKKNQSFDLIITDILMPNINGLRFLESLNRNMALIPPVIVISGHIDRTMILNMVSKGCEDFLSKPFEMENLLKSIQSAISE